MNDYSFQRGAMEWVKLILLKSGLKDCLSLGAAEQTVVGFRYRRQSTVIPHLL